MKVALILAAGLLRHVSALADCDAPGLSFPRHSGAIHGFTVTKLLGDEEVTDATRAGHTVVPFGDYHFSLAHESNVAKPKPVQTDREEISEQLRENLVAGEFDQGTGASKYSLHDMAAFDLNGDLEADVILFDVSPGANVYSGAVGVMGRQWFTIVEPTCY